MVEVAVEHQKPVRIGVNWGSLDQALLTRMMDENSKLAEPLDARDVMMEAMVVSALDNAAAAERYGLRRDQIILSAKVSGVRDLIDVYTELAAPLRLRAAPRPHRSRHGHEGHRRLHRRPRAAAARRHRRHHPRLAHAHARRRPQPKKSAAPSRSCSRSPSAASCRRSPPAPAAAAPPAPTSRSSPSSIQNYLVESMPEWKKQYPGVEELKLAVMGCIVNGPGESKHANIGISLPGTFEEPKAPVYVDGKLSVTLKGDPIVAEFQVILDDYVASHYGSGKRKSRRSQRGNQYVVISSLAKRPFVPSCVEAPTNVGSPAFP